MRLRFNILCGTLSRGLLF